MLRVEAAGLGLSAARRALDAYGGRDTWRDASAVDAVLSTGGAAFLSKGHGPLRNLHITAKVAEPCVRIAPFGRPGATGVFDGSGVRLLDSQGNVVAARTDPRRLSREHRRRLWRDGLDLLYFVSYAAWNYLVFPALLLRDDIAWSQPSDHTLAACFPPHLPTHCPEQRFHFDPASGLLRQLDYTAEVFGRWARAAHLVLAHERWNGVPFPSRRRVMPRGRAGRPWPAPTLVWIEVHRWQLR